MRTRQTGISRMKKLSAPLVSSVSFLIVLAGAALMILPFLWMLSTSLKPEAKVFASPPQWIPDPIQWSNFSKSLSVLPFGVYYRNTVIITAATILGDVLTAALVAYGFARFRFPGRGVLFVLVLSTIMLPVQVM
ncbi:MAG: carbohydrate ABC transporter permease, partial [Spirochaetes bacterium]|nr:carbohydrate ABC transporter permease [Spirochaetota bacterium]